MRISSGTAFTGAVRHMFGTTTGRVLFMLCLMYFITYVDRVNLSTAAPILQKELGLSNTQLGLVLSAFAYPLRCSRSSAASSAIGSAPG
jgi:sugar phosphate permease